MKHKLCVALGVLYFGLGVLLGFAYGLRTVDRAGRAWTLYEIERISAEISETYEKREGCKKIISGPLTKRGG